MEKKRIVIIDDDATTLDILSDFFDDFGYTVLGWARLKMQKTAALHPMMFLSLTS